MKKLKYQIRNFFGFSKKETNGFILLVILIILLLLIPFLVDVFYRPGEVKSRDKIKLDSLVAVLKFHTSKKTISSAQRTFYKSSPRYFDPNSADEKQLTGIFGKKVARTIVHFRKKGGRFFQKRDVTKIYGIDSFTYNKIEKFILLPEDALKENKVRRSSFHRIEVIDTFDINKADTSELQRIKGIGKVLSERIIKFRNKLGGFISEEQYKEVYGLDSTVVFQLRKYAFILKDFSPVKLHINASTFEVLASHPYISKKSANAIVRYREQHTLYKTLEELKDIRSIPMNELLKMLPYLDL